MQEPPGPPKRLKGAKSRALGSPCSSNFAPLSVFEMEPPGPPKRLQGAKSRALGNPCNSNFAPLSLFEIEPPGPRPPTCFFSGTQTPQAPVLAERVPVFQACVCVDVFACVGCVCCSVVCVLFFTHKINYSNIVEVKWRIAG